MAEELNVNRVGSAREAGEIGGGENNVGAAEEKQIRDTAQGVTNTQVQNQALQVTGGNANTDGLDLSNTPANGAITSTGVGARQYGRIDPTNGNGINNTQYTNKVLNQMGRGDYHGFPSLVDEAARGQRSFPITNGDGKIRSAVEMPGAINGKPGNYQYIVEPNGRDVNHRLFVPEGGSNPIARENIIRGTNLMRGIGRVALPVGAAMDLTAIATSNDVPRTATEKAGAWAGSFAAAGATAQVAAPLLAAGPVGWVGYGAAVLGAGAIGYFGGEQLAGRAYSWLFGK